MVIGINDKNDSFQDFSIKSYIVDIYRIASMTCKELTEIKAKSLLFREDCTLYKYRNVHVMRRKN